MTHVYLVTQIDDSGPCFTDKAKAEALAALMRAETGEDFYVECLVLDPPYDDAARMLRRSWHRSST